MSDSNENILKKMEEFYERTSKEAEEFWKVDEKDCIEIETDPVKDKKKIEEMHRKAKAWCKYHFPEDEDE